MAIHRGSSRTSQLLWKVRKLSGILHLLCLNTINSCVICWWTCMCRCVVFVLTFVLAETKITVWQSKKRGTTRVYNAQVKPEHVGSIWLTHRIELPHFYAPAYTLLHLWPSHLSFVLAETKITVWQQQKKGRPKAYRNTPSGTLFGAHIHVHLTYHLSDHFVACAGTPRSMCGRTRTSHFAYCRVSGARLF